MEVECVFFGPLREAAGTKTVVLETDVETVGDLLDELEQQYPDLDGRLRDGDGLAPEVVVTLNARHVQHVEGLATTLSPDDVVRLTTAIYGGGPATEGRRR